MTLFPVLLATSIAGCIPYPVITRQEIRGNVVDAIDGTPLEGARVTIMEEHFNSATQPSYEQVEETRADRDGHFYFESVRQWAWIPGLGDKIATAARIVTEFKGYHTKIVPFYIDEWLFDAGRIELHRE